MNIFGKSLSEYISFQKVILLLILAVGVARLVLSLAGMPTSATKWLSITVVALIGIVYYAIRVHTAGFGSYKQLLPLNFIQSVLAHGIVAVGIVIAIFTQKDNVFSVPEYSGGQDGKTWLHVVLHLIAGFVIIPLLGWLISSILLFIVKRVAPREAAKSTSA